MKVIITIFALFLSLGVSAEFNYDRYKQANITIAIKNLNADPTADYFFEAGEFKYRTTVTYTGNHRRTVNETQNFIEKWIKTLGLPEDYKEMFPFEIEVRQEDRLYWLPIQKILVEPFSAEVLSGSSVTIFIMTAGAVNQMPVFLINEFKAK